MSSQQQQQPCCYGIEDGVVCSLCRYHGADLRLAPCGCTLHAKCVPLNLIVSADSNRVATGVDVDPVKPNTMLCPACSAAPVSSLHLFPVSLLYLDRAVAVRKLAHQKKAAEAEAKATNSNKKTNKTTDQHDFLDAQAESSYLLLSQTRPSVNSGLAPDNDYQRTGRWTDEEVAFVDFLVQSFDQSKLPMPQGMKLNDFLCEMLLCKPSRLTKKMKNARLSVRSYELRSPVPNLPGLDRELMTTLQEHFLQSLSSEAAQLELRFNMMKSWRSHFYNLCTQIGSTLLDASEWVGSLEELERRASKAEETIRAARRRRMGLALKTDVRAAQPGVFFAGVPVKRETKKRNKHGTGPPPTSTQQQQHGYTAAESRRANAASPTANSISSSACSDADSQFISSMLDLGTATGATGGRGRTMSEDFTMMLNDIVQDDGAFMDSTQPDEVPPSPLTFADCLPNNSGPFLEEIVTFMESNDLPFQHVDIWVPSFDHQGGMSQPLANAADNSGDGGALRLYHAGHATRTDLEPEVYRQMHEFGEYSGDFSFAPGVGLPGRVFASGEASWECHLSEADPNFFKRAGGAKVYGVRTGLGIPLTSAEIGRVVVVMYSTADSQSDPSIIKRSLEGLSKFAPEPKWKLIVEMGSSLPPFLPTSCGSTRTSGASVVAASTADAAAAAIPPPLTSAPAPTTDHFNHASTSSAFSVNSTCQANNSMASRPSTTSLGTNDGSVASSNSNGNFVPVATVENPESVKDDQRIATLLGNHMPMTDVPLSTVGQSTSSDTAAMSPNALLLPCFISLRLLLLRTSGRRSQGDNELLDIIRQSYRGYVKDQRRSDEDIAYLLAKDWQFLKSSMAPPDDRKPPAKPTGAVAANTNPRPDVYTSHVMDAPGGVSTLSVYGSPVKQPSPRLVSSSAAPMMPKIERRSSLDGAMLPPPMATKPTEVSAVTAGTTCPGSLLENCPSDAVATAPANKKPRLESPPATESITSNEC